MEIYVDELPKNCIECPFCKDVKVNAGMDRLLFCKANKGKAIKNIEKSFDKCIVKNEFQSLADHDKQVRKEVCEEIGEQLGLRFDGKWQVVCDGCMTGDKTIMAVLDQVQGLDKE